MFEELHRRSGSATVRDAARGGGGEQRAGYMQQEIL